MADNSDEPVSHDKDSRYNKYPLKPSMWQRVKEGFDRAIPNDLDAQREAIVKRRLKYNDTDSSGE